jgi:hypothetical protein
LSAESRPPLRARLHWYLLNVAEFALLTAMCERSSDGSSIWQAIPRLAAYSKLSERQVQRLIRGLCARGILTQLAPANARHKRWPATYRINELAMVDDPRMAPYRTDQFCLPGIRPTGDMVSPVPVTNRQLTGDMVSPDSRSKANSRAIEIQRLAVSQTCRNCGKAGAFDMGSQGWLCPGCIGRAPNPNRGASA